MKLIFYSNAHFQHEMTIKLYRNAENAFQRILNKTHDSHNSIPLSIDIGNFDRRTSHETNKCDNNVEFIYEIYSAQGSFSR